MAQAGAGQALFSLKSFAAAMLAYYVALRIGLPRPYWAVVTCYIVGQPLAGAVLSKALFRMIGTVVGAAVAIALVPNLVYAPEFLALALALWVGVCTYVSLLDRTPRAYVALLAGYTAIIIGFPGVSAPATVFTIASLRVQEIVIGIVSASFVHGVIFPQSVGTRLAERVDAIMRDAERWSRDALAGPDTTPADLDNDRRRLAVDLHELHQLAVHLPYDTVAIEPKTNHLRALQDRLAMLLPLASAIEDRITQLRLIGGYSDDVDMLIEDVRRWLAFTGQAGGQDGIAEGLSARARQPEPRGNGSEDWPSALRLSLLDRLHGLIANHAESRALRDTS